MNKVESILHRRCKVVVGVTKDIKEKNEKKIRVKSLEKKTVF